MKKQHSRAERLQREPIQLSAQVGEECVYFLFWATSSLRPLIQRKAHCLVVARTTCQQACRCQLTENVQHEIKTLFPVCCPLLWSSSRSALGHFASCGVPPVPRVPRVSGTRDDCAASTSSAYSLILSSSEPCFQGSPVQCVLQVANTKRRENSTGCLSPFPPDGHTHANKKKVVTKKNLTHN